MNTLAPVREHPLLWALQNTLGLSRSAIHKASSVTMAALQRMENGHPCKDNTLAKLITLARKTMDTQTAALPKNLTPQFTHYMKACFATVNYIIDGLEAPPKPGRITNLGQRILDIVPVHGIRIAQVVAMLSRDHSASSIRRSAIHVGVIAKKNATGHPSWYPPRGSGPRPYVPLPTPTPGRPVGKTQLRLWGLIERMLGRLPEYEYMPLKEIMRRLAPHGFSKPTIFRVLKDMCLEKETTGFGPSKSTGYRQRVIPTPKIKVRFQDAGWQPVVAPSDDNPHHEDD